MRCPSCGSEEIKVIDSRPVPENNSIRRRRECLSCATRFTTYEVIDAFHPIVLKKDGSKEYFDKSKLLAGLFHACQKRPVDAEKIANEIEFEILNGLKKEISRVQGRRNVHARDRKNEKRAGKQLISSCISFESMIQSSAWHSRATLK